MKAKSFIVELVAAFALVMVSAVVATGAKAANVAPSITITANPNPVLIAWVQKLGRGPLAGG